MRRVKRAVYAALLLGKLSKTNEQTKMAGYILADVGDLSQFKASLDYIINPRPARALSQKKTF